MAKHKYEKKSVIDVVGNLDIREDKVVVIIDDVEYDFDEIVKSAIGTEIHFKSDLIED